MCIFNNNAVKEWKNFYKDDDSAQKEIDNACKTYEALIKCAEIFDLPTLKINNIEKCKQLIELEATCNYINYFPGVKCNGINHKQNTIRKGKGAEVLYVLSIGFENIVVPPTFLSNTANSEFDLKAIINGTIQKIEIKTNNTPIDKLKKHLKAYPDVKIIILKSINSKTNYTANDIINAFNNPTIAKFDEFKG